MQIIESNQSAPVQSLAVSHEKAFKASDLRAVFKAQGLKGKPLRERINQELSKFQPAINALFMERMKQGYTVTAVTESKTGITKYVQSPPSKAGNASALAKAKAEAEEAKAKLAKTEGEIAAMRAAMEAAGINLPS
jgi:Xaa-Pro aminopeptidase